MSENQQLKMMEKRFVIWDLLTSLIIVVMSVWWPQPSPPLRLVGGAVNPLGLVADDGCWEQTYSCHQICMLDSAGKCVTAAELLSMICLLWKMHVLLRRPQKPSFTSIREESKQESWRRNNSSSLRCVWFPKASTTPNKAEEPTVTHGASSRQGAAINLSLISKMLE